MTQIVFDRLLAALRECRTALVEAQPTLQGHGWMMPIEVVRADEVLDEYVRLGGGEVAFVVSDRKRRA